MAGSVYAFPPPRTPLSKAGERPRRSPLQAGAGLIVSGRPRAPLPPTRRSGPAFSLWFCSETVLRRDRQAHLPVTGAAAASLTPRPRPRSGAARPRPPPCCLPSRGEHPRADQPGRLPTGSRGPLSSGQASRRSAPTPPPPRSKPRPLPSSGAEMFIPSSHRSQRAAAKASAAKAPAATAPRPHILLGRGSRQGAAAGPAPQRAAPRSPLTSPQRGAPDTRQARRQAAHTAHRRGFRLRAGPGRAGLRGRAGPAPLRASPRRAAACRLPTPPRRQPMAARAGRAEVTAAAAGPAEADRAAAAFPGGVGPGAPGRRRRRVSGSGGERARCAVVWQSRARERRGRGRGGSARPGHNGAFRLPSRPFEFAAIKNSSELSFIVPSI